MRVSERTALGERFALGACRVKELLLRVWRDLASRNVYCHFVLHLSKLYLSLGHARLRLIFNDVVLLVPLNDLDLLLFMLKLLLMYNFLVSCGPGVHQSSRCCFTAAMLELRTHLWHILNASSLSGDPNLLLEISGGRFRGACSRLLPASVSSLLLILMLLFLEKSRALL